jgi:hypothetical protein
LTELVNSCIVLSHVLSCVTSSSSVFPLNTISSSSSEILSSVCSSQLECSAILFCISALFFFLRFSMSWVTSSLILSIYTLSSFIPLFKMFFVSLWCLYRASIVYFIFSCAFSYSLFLLSWNFLSTSCIFWLTILSIIFITLFDYLQDIFFQNVLADFIVFLGIVSLCFVGVWTWVSVCFISLWFLY